MHQIPRLSRMKMEIATKEKGNPLAQDSKDNKAREYAGPIYWNYGCLPQTWEDPNERHPLLDVCGDK
jgi:inorganic pyrophosphatase